MESLFELCGLPLSEMQRGAEFIEPPRFDYPDRTSRMLGQTAYICQTKLSEAVIHSHFPNSIVAGFLLEQVECESAIHALIMQRGRGE